LDKFDGMPRLRTTAGRDARSNAQMETRPCTCHPDDNPPRPCPQRYAYSECVAAAKAEMKNQGGLVLEVRHGERYDVLAMIEEFFKRENK
jgi:hypothetical protein